MPRRDLVLRRLPYGSTSSCESPVATSPESAHIGQPPVARFGGFELDLQSGVLSRNGQKNRLQGQPLQLLELLLQQPGKVVTREQIQQHLWPDGTVVEFEHSVNAAVKRLREALGDDVEKPTFIETIPRRGYRFIARVENGALPPSAAVERHLGPVLPLGPTPRLWTKRRSIVTAGVAAILIVAALATWRVFSARPVLAETDVILLASFVNKTGDPIFDNSLDKALEVKLTESPFLSLFPEAAVRRTMGMMRHDPNERVTQELGIEICKRQGLKAVVVPEIDAFGSKYLITLEAIEARNQRTIARRQQEAETKDGVIAALGKAASQMRRQLGESLSSLSRNTMLLLILRPQAHLRRYKPTAQGRRCIVLEGGMRPFPFTKGPSNWTRSSVLLTVRLAVRITAWVMSKLLGRILPEPSS